MNVDEVTLLLYMLLHRNSNVKQYIMKRSDIQLLVSVDFSSENILCTVYISKYFNLQVIPILRILYHAPDNTSHHIYMSLIILLILSEDESFNKRVHEIVSRYFFLDYIFFPLIEVY